MSPSTLLLLCALAALVLEVRALRRARRADHEALERAQAREQLQRDRADRLQTAIERPLGPYRRATQAPRPRLQIVPEIAIYTVVPRPDGSWQADAGSLVCCAASPQQALEDLLVAVVLQRQEQRKQETQA